MIQAGFKPQSSCPRAQLLPTLAKILSLYQTPLEGWAPSSEVPADPGAAGPRTTLEDPLPHSSGPTTWGGAFYERWHKLPGDSDVGDLQVAFGRNYTLLAVGIGKYIVTVIPNGVG